MPNPSCFPYDIVAGLPAGAQFRIFQQIDLELQRYGQDALRKKLERYQTVVAKRLERDSELFGLLSLLEPALLQEFTTACLLSFNVVERMTDAEKVDLLRHLAKRLKADKRPTLAERAVSLEIRFRREIIDELCQPRRG